MLFLLCIPVKRTTTLYFQPNATDGLKYMHIGGSILIIDSIAEGTLQIPSPQINPAATAPAKSSDSLRFTLSQTNKMTVPTNMSIAKYAPI